MLKLATLCYVRDGENTLMLHRNKKAQDMHEGKWNGLGGTVENGETPEACAIREVKEESGLDVIQPVFRGFITFPNFDGENDWYVFVFRFDGFEGDLIDSPEGELKWITPEEMNTLSLWEGDRIFMEWLDGEDIFSSEFQYHDGRLLDWTVRWY